MEIHVYRVMEIYSRSVKSPILENAKDRKLRTEITANRTISYPFIRTDIYVAFKVYKYQRRTALQNIAFRLIVCIINKYRINSRYHDDFSLHKAWNKGNLSQAIEMMVSIQLDHDKLSTSFQRSHLEFSLWVCQWVHITFEVFILLSAIDVI